MSEKLTFKLRARLMFQLGEQLIRNESIALLELIKNAYDADASKVKITMKNIEDPEEGIIIIEDDGSGMTPEIIKNVWMELGSDYKERLVKENKRTPRFGRLPLGEKGIGRFAVHKLGNVIELITKAETGPEVIVSIDWTSFEKSKYLEEVPIEIVKRAPIYFKNKTGTKIVIKKLKNRWTRGMIRNIFRSVNSFCSPFDEPESFNIEFEIDRREWLDGLLSWEDIKEYALFRFKCVVDGTKITSFRYDFTPWPAMIKLNRRSVSENDEYVRKKLRMVDKNGDIDLSKFSIGSIRFEGLIFDRDTKILSLGIQDRKGLKEYLDKNGGIRVYRDGIRVYDYGEPGNDWLDLDIRRVNTPTKKISNNIILAAVFLERDKSENLIEKTNREGFIENDAFKELKRALLYSLSLIEELRYEDKQKIRKIYGIKSKDEPVHTRIKELKKIVEERIKEESLKKEITNHLNKIDKEYNNMKEIFLRSAGAGLTLSIVIHEIEKIIDELKNIVKYEKTSAKVVALVKHLSKLIEGYTIIIRRSETKKWDLKTLIEQAIFNMEYRFKIHKIQLIKSYDTKLGKIEIKCSRNLIINSLINIMDNSIWWLEYAKITNKKIFVTISDAIQGYISVIIADNGLGFTLPPDEITKPFVSGKPDGMGLGLHIVDEVMKIHKGMLLFPDQDEIELPDEFKNGAIVVLAFKRK